MCKLRAWIWAMAMAAALVAGQVAADDAAPVEGETIDADEGTQAAEAENAEEAAEEKAEPAEEKPDSAEPAAPVERHRVAALDVTATGAVDPQRVAGLSAAVRSEAGRYPQLEVISSQDIRTVLGYEAERQLVGCEDDSVCLAELAGAMGAAYLLSTEVSQVGERWLFSATLIDGQNATALGRATRRVSREADLIEASELAVREAIAPLVGLDESAYQIALGPRSRTPAWIAGGSGAAVTLVGGALYGMAWRTRMAWDQDRRDGEITVTRDEARRAERNSMVGLGLMGTGVAVVGVGILLGERASSAAPRIAVVPVLEPDGGTVLVAMEW